MARTRPSPRVLITVLSCAAIFFVYLAWVETSLWNDMWARWSLLSWDDHDTWQAELDAHRRSCDRVIAMVRIGTVLTTATALVVHMFVVRAA